MKIFSVLAELVLWELSIVSSLSLYSILVQHACNDRAWLTSEGHGKKKKQKQKKHSDCKLEIEFFFLTTQKKLLCRVYVTQSSLDGPFTWHVTCREKTRQSKAGLFLTIIFW